MGRIVKYCSVCEESFSEKFSFCPNCAAELTAFEMNPLGSETKSNAFVPTPDQVTQENLYSAPPTTELVKPIEMSKLEEIVPQPPTFLTENTDILELEDEVVEKPLVTAPAIVIPPIAAAPTQEFQKPQIPTPVYQQKASFADEKKPNNAPNQSSNKTLGDDGFYSVTLVEQRGSATKRMLLLAAFALVMGGAIFSVVASIYNYDAYIGALEDDLNNIVFVNDTPAEIEPELPEPKNKDEGGGGGGGGQKDPTPTSKGVLASQSEKPMIPPSAKMDKVTNPELVLRPETQGNRKEKPSNDPYGDPNGKFNVASDGTGSGGGQGGGTGRGQGNGRGTGAGNGDGSGNGNGIGNGNGSGRGSGDNGRDDDTPPPPARTPKPEPVGPTVAIQITSKPRANYTDAARTAQIQGTVTLRVTFNANGTIGSISPVSGLPNGLTEQAIAAARGIRFEPAKKNGQPYTVTKQVAYSFTLY